MTGPMVFNEQRIEFTLMPDFLATCKTREHPHMCSRLCIMFGPEPVAVEMTSLDRHTQCTSWQWQLELSCYCGEGNSLGSTASLWRNVRGQADFRLFSKDVQPGFGGGSFLFIPHCHGTTPNSFVCSCARSSQHCVAQTLCSPHFGECLPIRSTWDPWGSAPRPLLSSPCSTFCFFPSTRMCLVATCVLSEAQRFIPCYQ